MYSGGKSLLRARTALLSALCVGAATLIGGPLLTSTGAGADTTAPVIAVNFGAQTTAAVSGYTLDYGQAFDTTRGSGWKDAASGQSLSFIGNGRERKASTNKLLDTLMQVQLAKASAGVHNTGRWEATVANGDYSLTVAVGDDKYTDSHDVILAEGKPFLDFTPTTSQGQTTVTGPVTITDGRLTIDVTGGTNTKIDYLTLTPVATPVATLTVASPQDNLGLGSRLVFSTVANEVKVGQSLSVHNPGTDSLDVTGLTFGGALPQDFGLCAGQPASFKIAAAASAQICVQYNPTVDATTKGTQTSAANLTIASSDAASGGTGSNTVTLGGLNSKGFEGAKEPNLQQIFTALGYRDSAGVTNWPQFSSISATSAAVADEVLSPYWKAANAGQPVQLIPIAHYSGIKSGDTAPFGWFAKGSTHINNLYAERGGADGSNHGYGQNQLLLPTIDSCTGCTGTTSFSPTTSFGLVDNYGPYYTRSDDALNKSRWHNLRFYPAKDAGGKVIAGTYLVGDDTGTPMDNSEKNWDYQDFAWLLVNATPDTTVSQPTPAADNLSLASFPGTSSGVLGSGLTGAQGTVDATKVAYSNGNLNITTADGTDTQHTNALQLPVNMGDLFTVQSDLVGPFTSINSPGDQQSVFIGPDASNYLRAGIEWNAADAAAELTIVRVVTGTSTILAHTALPTGAQNGISLRLNVDPSTQDRAHYNSDPIVTVTYAVNGSSAFTALGTSYLLATAWATASTPAGLMTANGSGAAAFTAGYATFGVRRQDPSVPLLP